MKDPKLLFRIDHNLHGHIYINKKWQKDVVGVEIHGAPYNYSIEIERYKRNGRKFVVENGSIVTEKVTYEFKHDKT